MNNFKDIIQKYNSPKETSYKSRNKANSEPLANLDYSEELKIKELSIKEFWTSNNVLGEIPQLIPSPKPRKYRSTSKRRVQAKGKRFELFTATSSKKDDVYFSELEPNSHIELFNWVANWINEERNAFIAKRLNWITIRGHHEKQLHLIINISHLDGSSMKAFKKLSLTLPEELKIVRGAGLYLDPEFSDYYLDSKANDSGKAYKHLFGPEFLNHQIGETPWRFPIIGFSQINIKALNLMLEQIKKWIKPDLSLELLDLYCGYGFFSVALSERFSKSLGIDWAGPSIEMARKNISHQKKINNIKLLSREIDSKQVNDIPKATHSEVLIIDPPKHGTSEGVIESLALRNPLQVFHIFCGVDNIPQAVQEWKNQGYHAVQQLAFDFFPGTANLEIIILFEKKLYGI